MIYTRLCLAMSVLIAVPAFADCNTPLITVSAGEFSSYLVPDGDTLAKLNARHGTPPGSNHVLVIDQSDGTGYWITRDLIGEAVLVAGGNPDGFTYSGPPQCRPTDIPVAASASPSASNNPAESAKSDATGAHAITESGNHGHALPQKAVSGAIQPRRGMWKLTIGDPVIGTCPAMMKASMGQSLSSTLTSFLPANPLRIEPPFHPDQLEFTIATETDWSQTSPGTWQGDSYSEIFANLPAGSSGPSGLQWDLNIISETEIQHGARIQVVMPPEAKTMLGGDTCVVTSLSTWTWISS